MTKLVVLACGLGDLFQFLTRLDDFFEKNPEYTSIKFFVWNHHPELAKELVALSKHDVSIFSLVDMVEYLRGTIPSNILPNAEKLFITQNPTGVGVDKYLEFIHTFFPNIEQWVNIQVYNKYKTKYPYKLESSVPKREKPWIVIHPFSTTVKTEKPERSWSSTRWGSIIRLVKEYCHNEDVILIGTKKDKVESVREISKKGIVDLRGKVSLTESISLVQGAEAVIGINSWPTTMSMWNTTPTYAQWFVQNQFLDLKTHIPMEVSKMKHVEIEQGYITKREQKLVHPTVEEAWVKVKKVLDAAVTL